MIKAVFTKEIDGRFRLDVEGHAGYAKEGPDIVCASASILAYTLAQMVVHMNELNNLKEPPTMNMEPGNTHITFCPDKSIEEYAELIFCTIQTGFMLLDVNHPENVKTTTFLTEDILS